MELWQALLLAVIEGLTEYLPISSTGHLVLTSSFLGIEQVSFVKDYTVMVQFGAILSVLVLYFKRFKSNFNLLQKIAIAFMPAAFFGFLLKNKIDALLGNPMVVAVSFVVGGVLMLWIEHHMSRKNTSGYADQLVVQNAQALRIGLFQCAALIPGVSRSAASISGGLLEGLDRSTAAEFSFLLAVPTLSAATFLKAFKIWQNGFDPQHIQIILIGNIASFAVGVISIKGFIHYLNKHGFRAFALYRIVIGLAIAAWLWSGHSLQI